jgi:N-acetylneuraminate epimerase
MSQPLIPIPSELLGFVASIAESPVVATSAGCWRISWLDASGTRVQATAPWTGGGWTQPIPLSGIEPQVAATTAGRPDGFLAWTQDLDGPVALRSGRRLVGVPPRFPRAGLVVCRQNSGQWVDFAFADDSPDGEILAAVVEIAAGYLLAVYLVTSGGARVACRAIRLPLNVAPQRGEHWRHLPDYPRPPGVAAAMVGTHAGALLAAGGANFPDQPPWENGIKKTYDEIFVLTAGATEWRQTGRLKEPRAYAAMVSVPEGVLAIGGENAAGFFNDATWLTWDGREVVAKPAPALPVSLASPVAAMLNNKVYLAGGYAPAGAGRVSTSSFFCLDLADLAAGWRALSAWPGPSRALAVAAVLNGAFYLISGLEMTAGADGQPQMSYLTDAYRYRPGAGWERLPDLPWSVVAAPSPAPAATGPDRVFIFGGVDGRQVGKVPRDRRVPDDILYFDVARHEWRLRAEAWPEPVVCSAPVPFGKEWVFVSGEIMAGRRTTVVRAWRAGC